MKPTLFLATLVASLAAAVHAFTCRGPLPRSTRLIPSNVVVDAGATCILRDVAVTGSVLLRGGNLVTQGQVNISGSLTAHGQGTIELFGRPTILGVTSISAWRGATTVGSNAKLGSVFVADTDVFEARGTMTSLSVRTTKAVRINGGRILLGGINVERSVGDVVMCGATISGGIQMLETTGSIIAATRRGCAMSKITGSIFILKGAGNVMLDNVNITRADLIVAEQKGNVFVRRSHLSDVGISAVTGNITLNNVNTDSDVSISGNLGSIRMLNGNHRGDMRMSGNKGGVQVLDTSFNNEVVTVHGNNGPVDFVRNKDFSIGLNENLGAVTFVDNVGRMGTVNNNHQTVYINGNTLFSLTCVDNTGRVSSGTPGMRTNTITGVRSGQCATL